MNKTLALLIFLSTGCVPVLVHQDPPPFCSTGFLVRPKEYMGVAGIVIRGEMRVFPLYASDSICLLKKPTPYEPPTLLDSVSGAPSRPKGQVIRLAELPSRNSSLSPRALLQ